MTDLAALGYKFEDGTWFKQHSSEYSEISVEDEIKYLRYVLKWRIRRIADHLGTTEAAMKLRLSRMQRRTKC
jgi:hypothetical protein